MQSRLSRGLARAAIVATAASSLTVAATAGSVSAAYAGIAFGSNSYSATDFANPGATLALNGAAQVLPSERGKSNVLQLVPDATLEHGSAWGTSAVATGRSFRTDFAFDLYTASANDAGDGFTFTVQNSAAGPAALGGCGADLGYQGGTCDTDDFTGVDTSVAVAFNVYAQNTIALLQGGDLTQLASVTSSVPLIDTSVDGAPLHAWIDYDAAARTLKVYVASDGAQKPASPELSATGVDVHALVGDTGYPGFTAATGGAQAAQDINSWNFDEAPAAPSTVTATPGASGADAGKAPITVDWTPATDTGGSALTGFTIYRKLASAATYSLLATVNDGTQTEYVDGTGVAGQAYDYQVAALNAIGASAPAATTGSTTAPATAPGAPSGVVGAQQSTNVPAGGATVQVSWSAPADTGNGANLAYTVERSADGGNNWDAPLATTVTSSSYNDTSVAAGSYRYRVTAHNDQGTGPAAESGPVTVTTAPAAPGSVTATAPTDLTVHWLTGAAELTWSAPATDGGSTVTSYKVYRDGTQLATDVNALAYTDASPITGGVHDYTVAAINANGEGAQSATASVFLPATPGGVTLSPDGNGQLSLSWNAPPVPQGSAIGYRIFAVGVSGSNDCKACQLGDANGHSTPDAAGNWLVGDVTAAEVENVPSGNWQFRVVPIGTNGGNTAEGLSAVSTLSGTIHTVRYVSSLVGDDTAAAAIGNDCVVPNPGAAANFVGESTACATIQQALAVAGKGDQILVGHGTYSEGTNIDPGCGSCLTAHTSTPVAKGATANVAQGSFGFAYGGLALTKPLQLIADPSNTTQNFPGATGPVVIDAAGFNNGVVVDLGDNYDTGAGSASGSASLNPDVVVSGFTIQNANAEGLLVVNSDAVRIADNVIQDNDKGSFDGNITDALGECRGTGSEPSDCGEGLHLMGVTRSVFSGNTVQRNSGGILVDDRLPTLGIGVPTSGNTISDNQVLNNALGSGITVAGHDQSSLFGGFSLGIFDNVIENNVSSGNGRQGEGAGVLLAVDAPADAVYQNVVRGNTLANDGLPGVTIHAHEPLAYMDDNVIQGNQITSTGLGSTQSPPGDPDAGVKGTAGIVVLGTPADPIGGTIIQSNHISAVTTGIVLNEASQNLAGNSFTGVTKPLTVLPAPSNVYAVRGSNAHLLVNTGVANKAQDLGGLLAAAPAAGSVPVWDSKANYWSGRLAPIYAARTTAGRIAVRSTSHGWQNLAAPTSHSLPVVFTGSPAVAGSAALDNGLNGGLSLLGVAAISSKGDLWLTSIVIGPNQTMVGVSQRWRNFGRPSGTNLVGTPAITGVFFANTAYAAARNGYLYTLAFDPSTADWESTRASWIRHGYRATSVAAGTAPDGYRTVVLLTTANGTTITSHLASLTYVNGVAGKLTAVQPLALGQPGVAVATNGTTVALEAVDGLLHTQTTTNRKLGIVVRGGVSATALN